MDNMIQSRITTCETGTITSMKAEDTHSCKRSNIELRTAPAQTIMDKLAILTDAAKYDVACTSSGVDRKGNGRDMGNCTLTALPFYSQDFCIAQ